MLGKTLRRLIKHGRLTVVRADGDEEQFGKLTPAEPRPDVAVRLKGALTSLKLALHPDLYLGELYMDGALVLERGTLWDLLELLGRNQLERGSVPGNSAIGPLQAVLRWIQQSNSRRAARRHVARPCQRASLCLTPKFYPSLIMVRDQERLHHQPRRTSHMDQSLENRIRERAYEMWTAHGCVHGQAEQHWLAAEREILAASTPALAREPAPKKKRRSPARSKAARTLALAG